MATAEGSPTSQPRHRALRVVVELLACAAVAVALVPLVGRVAGGETAPAEVATPAAAPAQAGQDALVERGRQLYLTGCSSCHGADAQGIGAAPDLHGVGAAAANFMLTTGRMPMATEEGQPVRKPPAYGPDDIDALVAYVASLGPGPAVPVVDIAGADLAAGGALFLLNCAPCHNSEAAGGALSYGRHAPTLVPATPVEVVEALRIGPGEMPRFDESAISDDEATLIAAYVTYLKDPDNAGGLDLGRVGPVGEGFVALFVGLGGSIVLIRFINRRDRAAS